MVKIAPYVPETLEGYRGQRELLSVVHHAFQGKCALAQALLIVHSVFSEPNVVSTLAHKAYYEAGVLHGRISGHVIMRIPHETQNDTTRGILLDLDSSYNSKRRASKLVSRTRASPKSREESKANAEESKRAAEQYEKNASASDAMPGRGMKKWLAGQ
ncbi:uncharacterized protein PHACADRAFT_29146 [Phanerochaete carnosa HHB-10118-sp]|uniref:Uncharacterized protein n=1 Tax=Phanerochaete carnosa (strain HHB-10118-sp) TaxID=650164 RepID=K5VXA3_PHACS|nr:uncharacterized protein PHACADRAFT_29146 [Phanerochaete carnosa HHB-10118-sp]EKM56208.1 hypothetical protein PHACADRAFT_29146 [Phanerochaete carnosa HHB-10118-sp]